MQRISLFDFFLCKIFILKRKNPVKNLHEQATALTGTQTHKLVTDVQLKELLVSI